MGLFRFNVGNAVKDACQGVLRSNMPEVAGAVGAWYTFRDRPYAMSLALLQVTDPMVTNSMVGAVVGVIQGSYSNSGGGSNKQNNGQGKQIASLQRQLAQMKNGKKGK